MQVDVIRAQHEHLRSAVTALASLTAPAPERLARAAEAVERAFATATPVWAAPHVTTVRAIAAAAATASPADLTRLSAAVVELYTVACREYWTA